MDKGTVIRTVVFFVAWANQALVFFGFDPFPEETLQVTYEAISTLVTVGASIVAWFKNNFVGAKGKEQERFLKQHGLK